MTQIFRAVYPYLSKYRYKYISGIIFLFLTNIFRVTNPKVVQYIIDYLKKDISSSHLALYSGLIVLIAVGEGIFLFLMRKFLIVASREVENDLRNDFFAKLLHLSPTYYQNISTGDIMSRATNDLNAVRSLLGPGIAYSANTLMAFLFIIPMMFYISPSLTLFALLPFPIVAFLVNRFGKAIYHRFEKIQAQLSVLSTLAQENISGNTIVKWFAREAYEIEKFRAANQEYMKRNIQHAKIQAAFAPSLMLTIGLSMTLIILFGGRLIIQEWLSLGEFTAFMLYMGILVWPSIALGWVIGLFQQGSASMKRIRLIMEEIPEISDPPHPRHPEALKGEIVFNNLTFGYDPEMPVLHNINLRIPPRQMVGILGPTGSGKSSLIKLIPHFHKLPEHQLLIDEYDINELPLAFLRRQIGYVSQETFLFSDTIWNNIAYGKPEASREEIEWAAKLAHVHEEITSFPEGYDSLLGERGLNLSGGQKQRISIARAILLHPQIFILDDAFSALDTYTEEQILKNLQTFFRDRTVILVSHRVSTLQYADFVVVLEEGEITDQGTHQALLKREGLYAWIYEKQLLEKELENVE